MVSIFNFKDFRGFMRAQWKAMPKAGYGQSRKLAEHLGVHTTLVSQIMQGDKAFTPEQAASACEFFALNDLETDYFLLLVQLDRAGTPVLRRALTRQIETVQRQARELSNRLVAKGKLTEEHRAVFYSDWIYSAVRQLTAIDGFQSVDKIAAHLNFSKKRIKEAVEFLLSVGLCKEESGRLRIGPASTHVESSSAWVRLHHLNWRNKSIEALNQNGPAQLHYTAPMTLSRADAEQIREMIAKFLESVDRVIEPSPSESLHCLNIDWFEVSR
ncbi:MAG: TIGR02147 family protein [Bdellovibrionales bacterium]